jgi:hypothetical protein
MQLHRLRPRIFQFLQLLAAHACVHKEFAGADARLKVLTETLLRECKAPPSAR